MEGQGTGRKEGWTQRGGGGLEEGRKGNELSNDGQKRRESYQ